MNPQINKVAIRNILSIRYNPQENSTVKPLEWRSLLTKNSDPSGAFTEKLLKNSITKSISPNNDGISISLSAGIDSTLCLALLREVFPKTKIVAICGVFEDAYNESIIAKKTAKKFDAEFRIVKMDSIFTHMPEIISISKKPRWNTYNHLIAKEAKKHTSILVTGDGADEIFGGYTFRYSKFLNLSRSKDNWKIKTINYLECHNRDWVPDQEYMFGTSIKFDWKIIYNYFKKFFSNPLLPTQQVMLADFNGKLVHDFVPTGNAIFNYYGLKGVPIFLDPEVIRFGMHLPISQKYEKKTQKGKLVLRAISKRKNVRHAEEKKGFSPNLIYDWKKHGNKICKKYILEKDADIYKKKLINHNWVIRAFEHIENDGDIRYLNRLISILALEIWYKIFITKELEANKKLY